ncbi:MAG: carboxylating nicotinate-nucleotide diphosphorylase [Verrucomicrobiae bacterium]|nr:carboxylating nicotinate-nucleotide diphosphorylase [Verrucomicrobiae bacterium]MDW8342991.1 carboxylating nicotinate-nucleotide diphosphorylase [Verrucomicrobiae bacterium]
MHGLAEDYVVSVVQQALAEDIGAGDLTSELVLPAELAAVAEIVAREPVVVAGLPFAAEVFRQLDAGIEFAPLVAEGAVLAAGEVLARVRGRARPILAGERTALNFLQRLSGIATLTREFVEAVAGTSVRILDTRKTTPTLRVMEKYAVRVGGGQNHRMGLYDAVMIKDNHRRLLRRLGADALAAAVRRVRKERPAVTVIVEADTLAEVEEALAAGADHILLDNMTAAELEEAVRLVNGRARTEASGGVRLANVAELAATGVDYISVGALTHSARAVDLSLEVSDGEA